MVSFKCARILSCLFVAKIALAFASKYHGVEPLAVDDLDVEKACIPPPPVVDAMPDSPVENLTVFIIPHSHDDTGWQRNVDQYYEEQVRYIYNTVVEALRADSDRTFLFVEVAFFMRWWREQKPATQEATRQLLKNGQIEFVNGGWCMADDASPSMDGQIDQVTLGHRYVQDTLDVLPKNAWHIDPFGLSASYASWFAEMNYTSWFFNRVTTPLKDVMHNETRLQFKWKPKGSPASIFAHVLDTHYGSPVIKYKNTTWNFDFEVFGGLGGGSNPGFETPVSDRDPSSFYNHTLEGAAEALVATARIRAQWYKLGPPFQKLPEGHGAIMIPFGDDMKFQNAEKEFLNMDMLIKYINAHPEFGVTMRYGTLSKYLDVIDTTYAEWPTFDGDFFPYGTNNNVYNTQLQPAQATDYWTGHYTTRPLMKGLVAKADGAKHSSEIAAAIACGLQSQRPNASCPLCQKLPDGDIMLARTVTSVLQHHDNIPGSSTPEPAKNLDVRLTASIAASTRVMEKALTGMKASIADKGKTATSLPLSHNGHHSVPKDVIIKADGATHITLWNSLAQVRSEVVELSLAHGIADVTVTDAATGKLVPSVVVPPLPTAKWPTAPSEDNNGQSPRFSSLDPTLVIAVEIPPLSTNTYVVEAISQNKSVVALSAWDCRFSGGASIQGTAIAVTFDENTNLMSKFTVDGNTWDVQQEFSQYHSLDNSNAYQFHPNLTQFPYGEPLVATLPHDTAVELCVLKTAMMERVIQRYAQVRVNTTEAVLMLEEAVTTFAQPTDSPVIETRTEFVMANPDRELVTRYRTDIDNTVEAHYFNSTHALDHLPVFETDANGMLMMSRTTNLTQWHNTSDEAAYHISHPVSGNYYPLASPGVIRLTEKTGQRTLAVLTDRAHGAAGLQRGWAEIMMGRRCAEHQSISVNDTNHIIARNWLFPSAARERAIAQHRRQSMLVSAPLIPVDTTPHADNGEVPGGHMVQMTPGTPLPPNVHLLSLDRVGVETSPDADHARVLLRLHHVFQLGEHTYCPCRASSVATK